MSLASMMATDKDALICDLAETYGILDYKALPVEILATLSVGLRDDSRIKMKMAGVNIENSLLLLAAAVDRLTFIAWSKTKDAEKGINKPKSIVEELAGIRKDSDAEGFNTPEEYEAARNEIIRRKKWQKEQN